MSGQVVGQAKVKVSGDLIETGGDVVLKIGGAMREGVEGDFQAGAYKEKTVPAELEFTQLVKAGTRIDGFAGETVTIEFDTGDAWVIRNAWTSDPAEITTSDGKAKRKIMGPPAEQVL